MLLSIITVNLNNKDGLKRTIASLTNQNDFNFEFILIDGGSTDGSLDIIHDNLGIIDFFTSELDSGIYDAMNKGISHSNGDYCLFLNSGDWLNSNTSLSDFFSYNPQASIVAGDIIFYDTVNNKIKWDIKSPNELTAKTLFWGTLPHQATLIKRSLFQDYGLYRDDLKIASDWNFFLKVLLQHNCSYQHIPVTLSNFAMDGISCNPNTQGLPRKEQIKVLTEAYPRFIKDYDKFKELENSEYNWISSRSYRAYKKLHEFGIIEMVIQLIRVKDFIIRKLNSKHKEIL